jgi:hypothetical protein
MPSTAVDESQFDSIPDTIAAFRMFKHTLSPFSLYSDLPE